MSRTRRHAPRAASVFLAAGLLALGYVAYVVADTKTYQAIEQKRFENLRGSAAVSPELAVGSAPEGFVVRARETRTVMLRAAVPSGRP